MPEETLASVPVFPVRLMVDFGRDDTFRRGISLCEWEAGFLEVEVQAPPFERCPPPARITGILVPLTDACTTGEFVSTPDWPEADALARGEIDVFDDQLCDVIEQRTLVVDPLE